MNSKTVRWFYSQDGKTCIAVVGHQRPYPCRVITLGKDGWKQEPIAYELNPRHMTVRYHMRRYGFQEIKENHEQRSESRPTP